MPSTRERILTLLPAARFKAFRSFDRGLPPGIRFIVGITRRPGPAGGRTRVQAVRFDKALWSAPMARAWARAHFNRKQKAPEVGFDRAGAPKAAVKRILVLKPHRVTQNRVGMPYGNCWEAALASIMGLDVSAVPDPRRKYGGAGVRRRFRTVQRWLRMKHGIELVQGEGAAPPDPKPAYWIATGTSPRGFRHAVVYTSDGLWHDPHPSRGGLVNVDGWEMLRPFDRGTSAFGGPYREILNRPVPMD